MKDWLTTFWIVQKKTGDFRGAEVCINLLRIISMQAGDGFWKTDFILSML